jgi:hypothetical protein
VTSASLAKTFPLATLDADNAGRIEASVRIPPDVPAGSAHVETGNTGPAAVEVTAR